MCKYKELYDISIKVMEEEQQRFNRMDEKAVKYFSVITFLLGICVFLGKPLMSENIPPNNLIGWAILMLSGVAFVSLFVAWLFCFFAIKQHIVEKMPLNDEMIKFFNENRLIDIYYALTKSNKNALAINRNQTNKKSSFLANAYRCILVAVIGLILIVVFWGSIKWQDSCANKIMNKGGNAMAEEKKEEQKPKEDIVAPKYDQLTNDNGQTPKEDVVAPKYDQITEGYDPVKEKIIEKGVIDESNNGTK